MLVEYHGNTHQSNSVPDVSSSKPVSLVPNSSCNRLNAKDIVKSDVSSHNKPDVQNGLLLVPDDAVISADSDPGSRAARIREYQDELLKCQTDRQHALLEARRRLQMRAEQLLDPGLDFLSESPSNKHSAVSHSQSLTALPAEWPHMYEVENNGVTPLSRNDVLDVKSSDMFQIQVDVSKPYKPELYQPETLSGDVEVLVNNAAAAASPDDEHTDDERQFVTPELKQDSRIRPCRVAEYSPSPSQQLSVSTSPVSYTHLTLPTKRIV